MKNLIMKYLFRRALAISTTIVEKKKWMLNDAMSALIKALEDDRIVASYCWIKSLEKQL